jgi:hypothetical protein
MGDRFDRLGVRHANVEALLRRPGIGHNNGPTFDMSWGGLGVAPMSSRTLASLSSLRPAIAQFNARSRL